MKIKIGSLMHEVILTPHGGRDHGSSNSARSSHWYQNIFIDLEQRKVDGIESDLWHEIVEMINEEYNLKLDHQQITVLGSAVFQVLNDNSQFFSQFPELVRIKKGEIHEDPQKSVEMEKKAATGCDHVPGEV